MMKQQPNERDHSRYSKAFRDGVREFLIDAKCVAEVKSWSSSFSNAEGEISQSYIEFLSEPFGSITNFQRSLRGTSTWNNLLQPFGKDLGPSRQNYKAVFDSLATASPGQFSWGYSWLTQWDSEQWQARAGLQGSGQRSFDRQVLVSLLNAFFCSTHSSAGRSLSIDSSGVGLRRICQNTLTLYEFDGVAEFEFTHEKLSEACRNELSKLGVPWIAEYTNLTRKISFTTDDFFGQLSAEAQDKLLIFLKHVGSWLSVTEIVTKKKSKTTKSQITKRKKPNNKIKIKRPRGRN